MTQKPQMAEWAKEGPDGTLLIHEGSLPVKMQNSDGTGKALLKKDEFGADLIHFKSGEGVKNHTHEGDHQLFVIKGKGWLEYDGIEYRLYPGLCYFVPGDVPHAIRAETELVLIAVGNKHRELDSIERMTPATSN